MPAPNLNNPPCPKCGRPMTASNTVTTAGNIQYRCRKDGCGATWVDSDRPHGSEPIGDRPMTNAERQQRYRAKKRAANPKKRGRPRKDKGEN